MTPGPKFSSSTSAVLSSARNTSPPPGCLRLSVRLRLLPLKARKKRASASGRSFWLYRATSPLPGSSTLTTSAPSQARICPHEGPAWLLVTSTTRIPASAPGMAPHLYYSAGVTSRPLMASRTLATGCGTPGWALRIVMERLDLLRRDAEPAPPGRIGVLSELAAVPPGDPAVEQRPER